MLLLSFNTDLLSANVLTVRKIVTSYLIVLRTPKYIDKFIQRVIFCFYQLLPALKKNATKMRSGGTLPSNI